MEGYNSLIKTQAGHAPRISADLLNARVNLKADMGFHTRADLQRPVRQIMQIGVAVHDKLVPYSGPQCTKSVMFAPGRFSHAKRLPNLPSPLDVFEAVKIIDPELFPDAKADVALNWSCAHNKLLLGHLSSPLDFKRMIWVGYRRGPDAAVAGSLFLPADRHRSVLFLVQWDITDDGLLVLPVPFKACTSIDLFKS
eukprot:9466546-Pyramimonas_sp.AAC.1